MMHKLGSSISRGVGKNEILSDVVLLPALRIGSVCLSDVPVDLSSSAESFPSDSNLGMGILKRFNTIFDFRKDQIYLQPDSLIAEPFPRPRRTPSAALLGTLLIGLFGLMVLLWVVLRKKARGS
jgi:hypothetical protein